MITIDDIIFEKGHPRVPSTTGGEIIMKDRSVMRVSIMATDKDAKYFTSYDMLCMEQLDCGPQDDEQKVLVKILRNIINRLTEKNKEPNENRTKP